MPDEIEKSSINISSNVLFHFTDSKENLLNILKKTFSARYCPEYGPYEEVTEENVTPPKYAKPMVSFCDLPLFLIKNHLKRYGPYGIGLKKQWGMNCGICPVLYVHKRAETLKTIKIISSLRQVRNGKVEADAVLMEEVKSLMGLVKSYEGPCWHRGEYKGTVRFYDEREWRYSPLFLFETTELPSELEYGQGMNFGNYNAIIEDQYNLEFGPDDIEYIILDDDDEIIDMVTRVRAIKERNYDEPTVTKLTTKILAAKRIFEDM